MKGLRIVFNYKKKKKKEKSYLARGGIRRRD
jgi:hypothetical protein